VLLYISKSTQLSFKKASKSMARSFLRGSRFIAGPKSQWNCHCSVGNVNKPWFLEKQKQGINS